MLERKEVSREIVEATSAEWNTTLESLSDVDPFGYHAELDRLQEALNGTGDNTRVYVLTCTEKDPNVVQAALLISPVDRGKGAPRMKVLNLRLHPRLDLEAYDTLDQGFLNEWMQIVSSAITEAVGLSFAEGDYKELKLFARTEQMFGFFQAVAWWITVRGDLKERFEVSCHRKWLVFRQKEAK